MDHADFDRRREQVIMYHKNLARVPGSGMHPNDAEEKARKLANVTPILDRPIAMVDDDRVHLCGACVATVLDGLQAYVDGHADLASPASGAEAQAISAFKTAKRILANNPERLDLSSKEWNDCLWCLNEVGVQCVQTDANNIHPDERDI